MTVLTCENRVNTEVVQDRISTFVLLVVYKLKMGQIKLTKFVDGFHLCCVCNHF